MIEKFLQKTVWSSLAYPQMDENFEAVARAHQQSRFIYYFRIHRAMIRQKSEQHFRHTHDWTQ